ncbi:MAG: Fic family protein [Planctomycetales bacterium]|nr:Fic family protein [Planctomycetales bacterium]
MSLPPPRRPHGRLVRAASRWGPYSAYVPHPLPPPLLWDAELASEISIADLALGRLAGVGETLPNPRLLVDPVLRLEAVLSSRIEGTTASFSDLAEFEALPAVEKRVPDVREVHNYLRAAELGLSLCDRGPVTVQTIRRIHKVLMSGVRGGRRMPGSLRTIQNWVGARGSTPPTARYVPPPPAEVPRALEALLGLLRKPSDIPAVARLALIHYQFEAIHPFPDGNGRVGRLLVTLLLHAWGILPAPLLTLSAYFESDRRGYYDGLLGVSRQGLWEPWVAYFARGIAVESAAVLVRARRLRTVHERILRKLLSGRATTLLPRLVEAFFSRPAMTVGQVARVLGVTPRAAQGNVDKLVRAGFLREATGRRRGRIFLAHPVVAAVEEETAPPWETPTE